METEIVELLQGILGASVHCMIALYAILVAVIYYGHKINKKKKK